MRKSVNHQDLLLSMILRTINPSSPTTKISTFLLRPIRISHLLVGSTQMEQKLHLQISVTKDQNITAKFKKKALPFTDIFQELSPTGGTISVTGYSDQDYLYFGESISFTATHQEHWQVAWSDTSKPIFHDQSPLTHQPQPLRQPSHPFHTILTYWFHLVDLVI